MEASRRAPNDGLPADALAASPTTPANLSAGLAMDDQFWRENRDKLTQRFNQWLGN